MKVKDILNITKGQLITGNENLECENFSKDTRTIQKGDIYIGIKGEKFDGSQFWSQALDNGADAVIIENIEIQSEQLEKYSKPIGSLHIDNYGITHDLPYDQRTYYMDSRGNEYWNQPWSRPFAKEEIGIRTKKDVTEEEVYKFVDNLSREKLVELSSILSEPLVRIDELERYNIVDYLDRNYDKFKENHKKNKVRKRG